MHKPRGMTLIDVVVGTALIVIVFVVLFGLMRASLQVSTVIKNESTAMTIANNQMEYIRSLPYTSVGTVGGIPAGAIPQTATTTEDGTAYGVRTFIDYYDDPSDGIGVNDTNGINTDYKRIKIVVTYPTIKNKTQQIILNSVYAPLGLETTANGGTLKIIVVNAVGSPVTGATVQIVNASTSPTVNLTTYTDSTGIVYLPGAATSTQYAVTVSKTNYSTAQTYARDNTNQNPTPGYLTVVQNQTTSSTFAIDVYGQLTLKTVTPIMPGAFTDSFADNSRLASITNTNASGNQLTLLGTPGTYPASGSATSVVTTPANLYSWGVASSTVSLPSGTTALVQVRDGSGNLIPDSIIPGNSTGFNSFPINLSGVSTSTYPSLELSAALTSSSNLVTPALSSWTITYQTGPTPIPYVSFVLTGAKTIGSTGAGAPIYKTIVGYTTLSSGSVLLPLEWDSYSVAISGYDVTDACGAPPYALSPTVSVTESLTLGTLTNNSMLVSVGDGSGNIVPGATVTLSRTGYSKTATSTACGNAYFGNLTAANDYSVKISKTGYTTTTTTGVTGTGHTFYAAAF
jgi:hypothetical protein